MSQHQAGIKNTKPTKTTTCELFKRVNLQTRLVKVTQSMRQTRRPAALLQNPYKI